MKAFKFSELYFASKNKKKYEEYKSGLGIEDLKWAQISVVEPQMVSLQYLVEEKIKAILPQLPNVPFFVEHTGLFIDIWHGFPGGLTSVFLDTVGNDGICRMMESYSEKERSVRGRIVIGLYHPSLGVSTYTGEVFGTIARSPKGENNFGWDPIFIPDGDEQKRTYAQMTLEEKNKTDMRKQATDQLSRFITRYFEL